jgi:hypothetical protein
MYIDPIVLDPADGVAKPWSEAFGTDPWQSYIHTASKTVPVIGMPKSCKPDTCKDK